MTCFSLSVANYKRRPDFGDKSPSFFYPHFYPKREPESYPDSCPRFLYINPPSQSENLHN